MSDQQSHKRTKPADEFARHVWFYHWFARGEPIRMFDKTPFPDKDALVTIDYEPDALKVRGQGYHQVGVGVPHAEFDSLTLRLRIEGIIALHQGKPRRSTANSAPARIDLFVTEGPHEQYVIYCKEVSK